MTIRDEENFMEGIWDWGILRGCFGDTKIEPTDIDGYVERRGHFLFLEAKKPDVPIPDGQWIALRELANKGDTVFVVWGPRNNPIKLHILHGRHERVIDPADLNIFRKKVSGWFEWANKERK